MSFPPPASRGAPPNRPRVVFYNPKAVFFTMPLGPLAVASHLDRSRYDINPGETFPVQVLFQQPCSNDLFSYGVRVSFPANRACVSNPASISPAAALNFNGVLGAGAFKTVASNFAAVKGSVEFSDQPVRPYQNTLLATFLITDKGTGSYPLTAGPFNTLGPTEQLFVSGSGEVLDSTLIFGSAMVNYRPQVMVTAPSAGQSLTGGAPVVITINASALDGAVTNVQLYADSVLVASASGTPLTFVWSNAPPGPHKLFATATDNYGAVGSSSNVLFSVSIPLTPSVVGGQPALSFPTVAGLNYVIEYCDSMMDKTWTPLMVVPGDGSLKSIPVPDGLQKRFYRVCLTP